LIKIPSPKDSGFFCGTFIEVGFENTKTIIMSPLDTQVDAATSTASNRAGKKSVQVKVNPIINFQLGLIAALLVVYVIIELQTPVSQTTYDLSRTMAIDDTPLGEFQIEQPVAPPKKQPQPKEKPVEKTPKVNKVAPPEIVKDDPALIDDPVTSIDTPIETPTEPATDAPGKNEPSTPVNSSPYNMVAVTEVPLFKGCSSSLDREERIECLNEKMGRYVQRRFDTGLTSEVSSGTMVLITVLFTIGTDGLPKDIQVKAPTVALEKEARRLIEGLPQMVPGKFNDVPVKTTYTLPIRFQIK
jgi:protein TonB